MSSETSEVLRLAKSWLNHFGRELEGSPFGAGWLPEPESTQERCALGVRALIEASPSHDALRAAENLFDEVCSASWGPDPLGERIEVGMTLSFVAWKHSVDLGLENESQEWIRTGDLLSTEPCTWFDVLAAYLYLPDSEVSGQLDTRLLGSSLDLFAALAILRRDRQRKPLLVIHVAARLVQWLELTTLPEAERHFFIGECSYLIASIARGSGKRDEFRRWLGRARREFRQTPVSRPHRAKIVALRLISFRDLHLHRIVERRISAVRFQLGQFGHYHEDVACRLSIALVQKMEGRRREALDLLSELAAELRHGSKHSFLSACLINFAELQYEVGEEAIGKRYLEEGMGAAQLSGDPIAFGNAWMILGASHVHAGRHSSCIPAFRRALEYFAVADARASIAYLRVLLAEGLLAAGQTGEAREELVRALPVLRAEGLIPEGIHALNLLAPLVTNAPIEVRERVCELQKKFGSRC